MLIIWGVALLLFLPTLTQAQPYQIGAGLRLGDWYGLQVKKFVSSSKALELIVSPVSRGVHISLLIESHSAISDVRGLYFYGGLGPHLAVWSDGRFNSWSRDHDYDRGGSASEGRVALGLDMILGLEYVIPKIPFSIALDWKPGVMILGYPGMIWSDVAISLRYVGF